MTNERIDKLLEILSDFGFVWEIMDFVDDESIKAKASIRIDEDWDLLILPNILGTEDIPNLFFNSDKAIADVTESVSGFLCPNI